MQQVIYIGIGGFFGSISRFIISRFIGNLFPSFPIGTLFVNVTGSFFLGFISYMVLYGRNINPDIRNMITVGFIGAYTTMSTFAFESVRLAEMNDVLLFGINLSANILLCLLAIGLSRNLAILITK